MFAISAICGYPLGWVMYFFYNIVNNYGFALILFTLFTKLILLPLAIKQQKSMAKNISFKPRLDEIQKQYANNKEKMNEETMKLYQEEKYNPLSGCLPLLIQLPILFGLIYVIYRPLTTIIRVPKELITSATDVARTILGSGGISSYSPETSIINAVQQAPDQFHMFSSEIISKIQNFDLSFLGIDLGAMPTLAWNILILVPILSGVTSILLSLISTKNSSMPNADGTVSSAEKMSRNMMLVMPAFSVIITFQVPAGVGMYWILSNIFSTIQAMILYKIYNPREIAAKAQQEMEERKAREKEERRKAKAQARAEGLDKISEDKKKLAMSKKELNRQKLAEARKRDAEKYGDPYVEPTSDDIN